MKLFTLEEDKLEDAPELFDDVSESSPPKGEEVNSLSESEIDAAFESLSHHTDAYGSLVEVRSSFTTENYSLNPTLFNEYFSLVTKNLGIENKEVIATESLVSSPEGIEKHQIVLEGIISGIWNAIKSLFSKIGKAISEFFKRNFTKLGVTKKRLENIIKTLEKSDKDLKELNLEKIPGSLKKVFPIKGNLDERVIQEGTKNADLIRQALKVINTEGKRVAKLNVLDRDFVAQVKSLKDSASSIRDTKKGVFDGTSMINNVTGALGRANQNRKKEKAAKGQDRMADELMGQASSELDKNVDVVFADDESDAGLESAKKEMESFYNKVEVAMQKLVDKPLPGKKHISEVKVDPETGISIDTESNDDEPDTCSLGSRSSLLGVCRETLTVINQIEETSKDYDGVNVTINKTISDVDKIIKDLDRLEGNISAKYKKLLEKKVKVRLDLLKRFFTNYSKLNKELLGYVVEYSSGTVTYSLESMKRFG